MSRLMFLCLIVVAVFATISPQVRSQSPLSTLSVERALGSFYADADMWRWLEIFGWERFLQPSVIRESGVKRMQITWSRVQRRAGLVALDTLDRIVADFDRAGLIVGLRNVRANGWPNRYCVRRVDTRGFVVERDLYATADSTLIGRYFYSYDDLGRIICVKLKSGDTGDVRNYLKCRYDDYGAVFEVRLSEEVVERYCYDRHLRLVSSDVVTPKSFGLKVSQCSMYDGGRLVASCDVASGSFEPNVCLYDYDSTSERVVRRSAYLLPNIQCGDLSVRSIDSCVYDARVDRTFILDSGKPVRAFGFHEDLSEYEYEYY